MKNRGVACQTVELTNINPSVSKKSPDGAPLISKSEESFYTARSREPSAHSVGPSNSISELDKGQMKSQQNSEQTEHRVLYRPSDEELEPQTMLHHTQCSRLNNEMLNDRYISNNISQHRTSSLTSHRYTDRPLHTIHSSNLSLPGSKSVASSKKSNTSKSCRSNNIESHETSILSEGVVCRICHEGDSSEVLVSPCYCSGSMGLLHVSCLQTWLGSSNKTTCEICNFQFSLIRKTMPVSQFLKNPGTTQDKRNLMCDIISWLVITPLTVIVVWICLQGADDHFYDSKLEKGGLVSLSVLLLLLYSIWLTVALRHNWKLWKDWKMFHQEVTLLCVPASGPNKIDMKENQGASSRNNSHSTLGSVQLQSVKINLQGPLTQYKKKKEKQSCKLSNQSLSTKHNEKKSSKVVLEDFHNIDHTIQPYNQQQLTLDTRCQDPSNQFKVHKNHGHNNFDVGATVCIPKSPRKSRKKYVLESKHSGKLSNKSSSEQSSLNAVYENNERCDYRQWTGYRPGHHVPCGKYLYNCDKRSDTEKSTSSYHTSGEFIANSRQDYYNHINEFHTKRSDNNSLGRPKSRSIKNTNQTSMAIFSRGGSPPEEKSDNYIAKWLNEQTNKAVFDRNNLDSGIAVGPVHRDKLRYTNCDWYAPTCQGRYSSQTNNTQDPRVGEKDKFSVDLSGNEAACVVQEISDFTQTDESICMNLSRTNLNSSKPIQLPGKDCNPDLQGADDKSDPYITSTGANMPPDTKQIVENSSLCNSVHASMNTDLATPSCEEENEKDFII